jgi:hypothetical protein
MVFPGTTSALSASFALIFFSYSGRMERQRGVYLRGIICVFVFTQKNLCGLCVLCG